MSDQEKRKRNQYTAEFKSQAIELAKEIGAVKKQRKMAEMSPASKMKKQR